VGGGIPIRRSSVEIISSLSLFLSSFAFLSAGRKLYRQLSSISTVVQLYII